MEILNGFDFIDIILDGGLIIPGVLVGIFIAIQGIFTLLKWLKAKECFLDKDNLPTLITSVGFFLGAFTFIFSTLLIEIPLILDFGEEIIIFGFLIFVFLGFISACIILAGMIWDFIQTRSREKGIE
ncbi:MAG: hypothetical protein GF329_15480 [Candidatus Lokiarchaeota archaeon]|nr:hypothetical protein [Candidatus Lokiarchaeota archaeon]